MKYYLPETRGKRIHEIQPVRIEPEVGESLDEIALQIACTCTELVTEDDKALFRKTIEEKDGIKIDIWKEQPIYLLLNLNIRHKKITISFYHWVRRWDNRNQNNGGLNNDVLITALNALEEMLEKANAILALHYEASRQEIETQIQKLNLECSAHGIIIELHLNRFSTPFSFFELTRNCELEKRKVL